MFDHDQFDRDFNRMGKQFNFMWNFTLIVIICIFIAIVAGMVWGINGVRKHGLKGVIENVWNGPNSPSTNSISGVTIKVEATEATK